MKRLFIFLILCFGLITGILAQTDIGYVFVVKIAPSWNGVVTYYEAFYDGKRFSESTNLTKDEFALRLLGREKSLANYQEENLFTRYGIADSCRVDALGRVVGYGIIDSLWKLRFAVYPYRIDSPDTLGWTGNRKNPYVPTSAQKRILARMGMDTVFYTIFGDNLFHLLHAMENPQWVANYKNAQ